MTLIIASVIARLVKDGRYFDPYLPQDVYAELRGLSNARENVMKRNNAVKSNIIAILDEYFPELFEVFKNPLTGKASRQVLRSSPFPLIIFKHKRNRYRDGGQLPSILFSK